MDASIDLPSFPLLHSFIRSFAHPRATLTTARVRRPPSTSYLDVRRRHSSNRPSPFIIIIIIHHHHHRQ